MQTNKTIKAWFEELKPPYSQKAISYLKDEEVATITTHKLHEAILMGFDWNDTVEGYTYWHQLFWQLYKKK